MKNPVTDEKRTARGWMSSRMRRGGYWGDDQNYVWASYRYGYVPTIHIRSTGFRIVRNKK